MSENTDNDGSEPEIRLSSDFVILRGETQIGYIEAFGEYNQIIGHIEIEPEYRGNGYGQAAAEAFVERAAESDAASVGTSVITSPTFEHILRELGFSETAHEEEGLYFSKSV